MVSLPCIAPSEDHLYKFTLDHDNPTHRKHILRIKRIDFLFCYGEDLGRFSVHIIDCVHFEGTVAHLPGSTREQKWVRPGDICGILYLEMTTGRPNKTVSAAVISTLSLVGEWIRLVWKISRDEWGFLYTAVPYITLLLTSTTKSFEPFL